MKIMKKHRKNRRSIYSPDANKNILKPIDKSIQENAIMKTKS
jgi:hypothetical protein